MRPVGIGVADALHDGKLAVLQQLVEALHGGVQANLVIDLQHLALGEVQGGPILVVKIVGVRDDGVEPIVAAGHLEDHENIILAGFFRRAGGVDQELRHHRHHRQRDAHRHAGAHHAPAPEFRQQPLARRGN